MGSSLTFTQAHLFPFPPPPILLFSIQKSDAPQNHFSDSSDTAARKQRSIRSRDGRRGRRRSGKLICSPLEPEVRAEADPIGPKQNLTEDFACQQDLGVTDGLAKNLFVSHDMDVDGTLPIVCSKVCYDNSFFMFVLFSVTMSSCLLNCLC